VSSTPLRKAGVETYQPIRDRSSTLLRKAKAENRRRIRDRPSNSRSGAGRRPFQKCAEGRLDRDENLLGAGGRREVGPEVQGNRLPDVAQGFLARVPATGAAGKFGADGGSAALNFPNQFDPNPHGDLPHTLLASDELGGVA
jgi:hypothetical protein